MRPPSSTSSSRTLLGLPRLTRAAGLAIGILLAAEIAVRILLGSGALKPDPTLDALVAANLRDLRERVPRTWLLGNSTLAEGVRLVDFERFTGKPAAKVVHGSATVRASAAMLDYYLKRVPVRPDRVLLLVSIDDINPNGGRARVSATYLDYADRIHVSPLQASSLVVTRGNLGKSLLAFAVRAAGGTQATDRNEASPEEAAAEGTDRESADMNLPWIRSMAAGFDVDRDAFAALREVALANGIGPPRVVLLPAADRYFAFHESCVPEWTLDRIRREVSAACAAVGLPFTDLAGEFRDEDLYKDAYHLNAKGAALMTRRIAGLVE